MPTICDTCWPVTENGKNKYITTYVWIVRNNLVEIHSCDNISLLPSEIILSLTDKWVENLNIQ